MCYMSYSKNKNVFSNFGINNVCVTVYSILKLVQAWITDCWPTSLFLFLFRIALLCRKIAELGQVDIKSEILWKVLVFIILLKC